MRTCYIVTDLGYGDAGKGTTVDYLARQVASAVVVRHSGGAQAAHNVVTPDGRHHTFAQFGSGSFVPGVRTHLSRFMLISPPRMMTEATSLIEAGETNIWQRLTIDEAAPIIMPWHQAATQLRELARGKERHGSVGIGISEVQRDLLADPDAVIRAGDLRKPKLLKKRLRQLQHAKFYQMLKELTVLDSPDAREAWATLNSDDLADTLIETYQQWIKTGLRIVRGSYLRYLARTHEAVIFEGSQGVLLDEWFGFHPYTTWSTTTSENAELLLKENRLSIKPIRLGVLRAYTTRHGPGPFVTEDAGLAKILPELHNQTGTWMGDFRYGHLDLVAHKYAVDVTGGVDQLVVTGLDRSDDWQYADQYEPPVADDLTTYFVLNKQGNIVGINVGVKDDLDHQERLTELLQSCTPQYLPSAKVDGTHLLKVIGDTIGVPVGIASYGPTAVDKRALLV
jgi:adenylosuccinate synthase